MHARADDYFNMAQPLSNVLTFIETDTVQTAPAYFTPPGSQLPTDVRTVGTHWSRATGHDIKAISVIQARPLPANAYLPSMATRVLR
jgi:hypothetical protein